MDDRPSHIGFDEFVLDLARGRLLSPEAQEIPLRPKAFDLLTALAMAEGRPMTKAELLDTVWANIHVTEDSLFQAVRDARRAIGDEKGLRLRNVPRRGYVLEADFRRGSPAVRMSQESAAAAARPSIAVLPFQTLGEPGDRRYIADGMAEEITAALSRFGWLFVVATMSAAVAQVEARSAAEIGERLSVRYLLDGGVTFDADRLIVRCRLMEAASGRHIWQGRVESAGDDLIALYDSTTSAVAAALEPRILRAEIERAMRKGTTNLDALDCYLRALPGYYSRTPAGNAEAIASLEAALRHDAHFHLARALLSRCIATTLWLGVERDPSETIARALALAREALAGDSGDPLILALSGHLMGLFANEHDQAEILLTQALRLNSNSAEIWRLGAWVATFGGESDLAIDRLACCEKLDPISPLMADAQACRAAAMFFARRFDEAVAAARRSIAIAPQATTPRRFLTVALYHRGDFDDARDELNALMQRQPNSSLSRSRATNRYRHQWMTDMMIAGLGASGMPG
ncbi:tetratricopeptide repeat protein [Terrarubrum flagellatum]|uniref:tetratricopeptide repeat protein n=1 Tax=Terrirubrum flagellatum TaxID=2895980 RepID=UPI003144DE4C